MSRINLEEYAQIIELASKADAKGFSEYKATQSIPNPNDTSREAAEEAVSFIRNAFIKKGFSLLDAIVAQTGKGPATANDTHYRGRVLEAILNGSFDGKPEADFAYAELKLTEVNDKGNLVQIIRAGNIFNKKDGEYDIPASYEESTFYKKMQRTIIVSYEKVGKQLGFNVSSASIFEVAHNEYAEQIKEDWNFIAEAMKKAIADEKAGIIKRKASGILSSRNKTPNGLLGIRSDSITITNKLFRLISE